jgi:uncharacterized protein YcbK (DUF882 family)
LSPRLPGAGVLPASRAAAHSALIRPYRRRLLLAGVACPLAALPALSSAQPGNSPWVGMGDWPGPNDVRQIWLARQETGEQVVSRYFDGRRLVVGQYSDACRVLRDVRAGAVAQIDLELLDLFFVMQMWLLRWGIDRPILVTSGYRTAGTNARLEGASRDSLHMLGRAADITMPGVPSQYLGQLAAIFKVGGVGFYLGRGFVHVDTGNVRYWRR